MIQFIKTKDPDNRFDISDVKFEFHSSCSLTDLCTEFEYFLKAMGYQFEGSVEIVEPESFDMPDYSETALSELEREDIEETLECVGCDRCQCGETDCTDEKAPDDDTFHTRLYDENFTGE